jgi:acyl-CoA synthetase (AMP-forming)/AMP-acid ligase II
VRRHLASPAGSFRAAAATTLDLAKATLGTGLVSPMSPTRAVRALRAVSRLGLTLACAAELSAIRYPGRTALVDERGSMSYLELRAAVTSAASALHSRHLVHEGDRLGILCRNHRDFVVAAIAGSRLGADLVFLSTDLGASALAGVLDREAVNMIVYDDEFSAVVDRSGFAAARLTGQELAALAAADGAAEAPIPAQRGRLVVLTSGTTGTPKGAPRDIAQLRMGLPATSLLAGLRLRSGEPMVIQPPLFHGFGLGFLAAALTLGCPAIMRRRCGARDALDLVRRHSATVFACVPVLLHRIMALPAAERASRRADSLRVIVSGAAPLRPALAAAAMAEFGEILFDLYGTTEAGWATLATPADLRAAPGTVGRPAHGVIVAVLDADGSSAPPGGVGEIFIGSGLAFQGYSGGGSRRTVRNLMSTGDLGYLDGDGRVFVVGRIDDMIVSGGENVYPREVEELLASHPAVGDVSVFGIADDEFGQRLAVTVVRSGSVTAAELRHYISDRLGRHKVPRDVEFVDDLERTSTGKPRRPRPTLPARHAGPGATSGFESDEPTVDRRT